MKNLIKFSTALLLIVAFGFVPVFAQKSKSKYKPNFQLVLSGYGGFTFNNMNVANNDIYPNPIHASSTFTFDSKIALDFQRTTKYGLIYVSA